MGHPDYGLKPQNLSLHFQLSLGWWPAPQSHTQAQRKDPTHEQSHHQIQVLFARLVSL